MPASFRAGPSERPRFALPLGAIALVAALALPACGPAAEQTPAATVPPAGTEPEPGALDPVVLADPSRPVADTEQDAGRRPIEVYTFFGVRPGDVVADVYAGEGYNTHLLSRLVGDAGRVYSVLEFYGEADLLDGQLYKGDVMARRIADAGLDNVELVMKLADVPASSVDVAIAVRNYHDVEWVFPQYKRADQLAQLYRILRPGGSVGIVEVATPQSGWDEAAHRLNEQVVVEDFTGAGFELLEKSDLLANPDDDHAVDGFPERHLTDRYVLRFRKPDA